MLQKDLTSILIVEDEQSARVLMGRIIERYSNNIYYAQNGAEGLEMMAKYQPDIVITDIKMPVLDGLKMIQRIDTLNIKRPIIILATAYSEAEYFIKAIELRVDHLLIKPIEADMLIEKIESSIGNIQNNYENKKLKLLLELQTKKVNTIFNFQSNIILLTDCNDIKEVNLAFLDFFGFSSLEEYKRTSSSISEAFITTDGFIPNGIDTRELVGMLVQDSQTEHLVKMYDKKRDADRLFIIKAGVYPGDEELYILSFTDISEIENNRKLLKILTSTDKLTKIYNRFKFDEILSFETSRCRRYKAPLSVLVFDIDFLKNINDAHGYGVGDSILQEMTAIVQSIIRTNDTFARFEEDEFAIILPNTNRESAVMLAEKIRETVGQNVFSSKDRVTISVGVTEYQTNETEQELLEKADEMLQKAKRSGRNITCSE